MIPPNIEDNTTAVVIYLDISINHLPNSFFITLVFGCKDSANFPFHQMFGGFSRHFFRHVSISKNAYQFIIYNCGTASSSGAVLHKVKTLQQRARYGVQRMGLREISISTSLPHRRGPTSVEDTANRMAALVYVFKCVCHFFIFYCKKQRMALQRCSVAALQGKMWD